MPNWRQIAKSHELELPDFCFKNGSRMDLKLRCRTLGRLDDTASNAALLLHGTTGSSLQFLQPDTADFLFGEGQPLDLNGYFIIMPDAIGHGESSKPSDELGVKFPQYQYSDIVAVQHAVIRNLFALDHLRLILGTSMGGMQTWMWGIAYPKMMDALMPIACVPQKVSGHNLLFRRLMLAMIKSDPHYATDGSAPTSHGLGLAWNLFQLMTASQTELARLFHDADAADDHIREIADKAESSQHAIDVVWEFNASQDYDPNDDLGQIEASLLTVNFLDDVINSPYLKDLDRDIRRVPRGHAVTIDAGVKARGHQTLSCAEVWRHYVQELLAQTNDRHHKLLKTRH